MSLLTTITAFTENNNKQTYQSMFFSFVTDSFVICTYSLNYSINKFLFNDAEESAKNCINLF